MNEGVGGGLQRWIRTLVGSEKLDDLPPPVGRSGTSFLGWLMSSENLPADEERDDRSRKSLLRMLFSSESLPTDEPPGAGCPSPERPKRGRAA